jgi:hypothetical protein
MKMIALVAMLFATSQGHARDSHGALMRLSAAALLIGWKTNGTSQSIVPVFLGCRPLLCGHHNNFQPDKCSVGDSEELSSGRFWAPVSKHDRSTGGARKVGPKAGGH